MKKIVTRHQKQKKYEYSNLELVPGMVLYHRGNYNHDKSHSFGEVTFVEYKDGLLILETKEGTKRFTKSDIGRFLFFDEVSASEKEIINGPLHLVDGEKNKYIREERDQTFLYEKRVFDQVVGKLKELLTEVTDKISTNKYGFSYVQELDVTFQKRKLQNLREQEDRYRLIIAEPYFAKLELGNFKESQVYIGSKTIHESSKPIILDWREPVAQLYYTKNPVEYKKYDLKSIRKFDIYTGIFCGYYDSYHKDNTTESSGIIDEFFLSVIKQRRNEQTLQDIIQTIQDKQYEIISLPSDLNLRVQGCAGSGKTMIMMHRISHILYNDKEISLNNIVIITPNKQLNLDLSEVAKKLDIDQIKRVTLQDYFLVLIQEYMKMHNISMSSKYYLKLKAFNEGLLNLMTLDSVMNDVPKPEFAFNFKIYINSFQEYKTIFPYANLFAIESVKHNHHKEFIEDFITKTSVLNTIMKRANQLNLLGEKIDVIKIKNQTQNKMNNAYRDFHSLLRKWDIITQAISLSMNDVMNYKITFEQSQVIPDNIITKLTNLRNVVIEHYKTIERIEQLEIQISSYLDKCIFNRYKEIVIDNLTLLPNKLNSQELFKYLYYYSIEYKKVSHLQKFNNGDSNSYLLVAWEAYLKDWKRVNFLDEKNIYTFEFYELLNMLHYSYGCLSREKKWIFVDEGQDYASPFIVMLIDVFPNAIINIFGDTNQRLANDYDSYFFDKSEGDTTFTSHEINTNYRNSVEITSYINEHCRMKMIPIGLHGSVTIYNKVSDVKEKWDEYIGRNIIIVKNESFFTKLVSELPPNILSMVRYNDFTFSKEHINIMSVIAVKGLEFENIMIYNDSMSQNEYYVACSRALNHLSILV
ncbi:AAA family ATPase [Acinetobacter sp. CUI P1]|nr:AAA family ATPase [Acinetobacter sp. CUI P1]